MKGKNATRYFSQFQVTIIVQRVFLLKLYHFTAQINVYFVVLKNRKNNFQTNALLL